MRRGVVRRISRDDLILDPIGIVRHVHSSEGLQLAKMGFLGCGGHCFDQYLTLMILDDSGVELLITLVIDYSDYDDDAVM